MNKSELVKLLNELNIPASECTPPDEVVEENVRLYFWDYIWDDVKSSDTTYVTKVTYQISFIANVPRHPKLLELKRKLNEKGIHPLIQHEYVVKDRRMHSYFSIDVLENLGEQNV